MKFLFVALGMALAQAQSTCSFTLNMYSENSCSTAKTIANSIYDSDGYARVSVPIGRCWNPSGTDNYGMKIQVCDPEEYIAYTMYEDNDCSQIANPPVNGLGIETCNIVARPPTSKLPTLSS